MLFQAYSFLKSYQLTNSSFGGLHRRKVDWGRVGTVAKKGLVLLIHYFHSWHNNNQYSPMNLHTPHFTVISNLNLLGYCMCISYPEIVPVRRLNRHSVTWRETPHVRGVVGGDRDHQSLALIADFTFYSAFSETGATKTMKYYWLHLYVPKLETADPAWKPIRCPIFKSVQSNVRYRKAIGVMMLTRYATTCTVSLINKLPSPNC